MDGWMREGKMKSQKADAHSKGKPQALCKPKPQDEHRFLTEENKTQRQQVEFKQARYLTSFWLCLSLLPHSAALDCFYFLLCLPSPSLSLPHSLHGPCSSLLASVPASSSRAFPRKPVRNTDLCQLKSAARPQILQPWATVSGLCQTREKTKAVTRIKTHTHRETHKQGKSRLLPYPASPRPYYRESSRKGLCKTSIQPGPILYECGFFFFFLHYEPAGSCSIGHSLLCRCTAAQGGRGQCSDKQPWPFVFACTRGGEGDAGWDAGSRLQPAAAAKEDKQIWGERQSDERNRQRRGGEIMREYETGLEGGV